MLPENTSIWTMIIALVVVVTVGLLRSRLRAGGQDYTKAFKGAVGKKTDRRRLHYLKLLRRNLELMTEAVARYQAILGELAQDENVWPATALRKTYIDARACLNALDGMREVVDDGVQELYGVCFAVFNEISLQCGAADMLTITGLHTFDAGFENLTAVYQMGGVRAYQPAPVPRFNETEQAEFQASVAHFQEIQQDLLRLLGRRIEMEGQSE